MKKRKQEYTVQEYAKLKGVSEQYIRQLCKEGKLNAKHFSRVWIITVNQEEAA